jgi:GTPase SAR1 family protein
VEKLIQYINFLTNKGKSLLFRQYGTAEVDRDLMLEIFSIFSEPVKEIDYSDIKNMQSENFKYFYTRIDTVIIIVTTDLEDDDSIINSKILSIKTKFIEKYGHILEDGNWPDDRTLFYEFGKELDNLILGPIKISILGFGGVGKSELVKLICGKDVDLEYIPTITTNIASDKGDEFERTITLWDFAGQSQIKSLWKNVLEGTDICILLTDSTFENINGSKEIIHDILDKYYPDKLVIGIANYQEMPDRLSPEFCERILSTEKRVIRVHGLDTRNLANREKILAILREAINHISNKYPSKGI